MISGQEMDRAHSLMYRANVKRDIESKQLGLSP